MSNQDRLINSDTIFLLNAMSTKEIVLRRVQIVEKLTHIPSTSGSIRTRLKEMKGDNKRNWDRSQDLYLLIF